MASIEELLQAWDGLAVVDAFDCTTETWIWIALHDDTLGQPVGGTRMRVYNECALVVIFRLNSGILNLH